MAEEENLQKNQEIYNTRGTKVMVLGKTTKEINIKIDNVNIEQVKYFKYLGVKIEEDGR